MTLPLHARLLPIACLSLALTACHPSGHPDQGFPRVDVDAQGPHAPDAARDFATRLLKDQRDVAQLTPRLTPSLQALLAKAGEADRRWAEAHPGEKPPLGDGEWVALFGLVDASRLDSVVVQSIDGKQARVDAALAYVGDATDQRTVLQLMLQRGEDGEWRLDDVRHPDGGSARSTLQSVIAP